MRPLAITRHADPARGNKAAPATAVAGPSASSGRAATAPRPVAAPLPGQRLLGGIALSDPYAWLEDAADPEVIAHLQAENAYTEAMMAPVASLRDELYDEIIGRVQRTDTHVPFRMGDWLYYIRTEQGRDYDILCRKRNHPDAAEEILLDLNELAADYLALGYYAPSYDHRYLAYALNASGGLDYTLYVKDLLSGETLPERLPSDGFSFEWAADSRTLIYTRQDETLRPCAAYRHTLGAAPGDDVLLYKEDDPTFNVSVSISDSKAFILLSSGSYESAEVRYLPADDPFRAPLLFAPRQPGVLYMLEHHGDDFLVLSNENAVNFTLSAVPISDPAGERRTLLPHRANVLLEWVDVFARHLLISGREDGCTRLWIHDLETAQTRPVHFDEPVHTVAAGDNREYDTNQAVFTYTAFVTPPAFFALDLDSGQQTLLKQEEVVGGYDPTRYVSERISATAPDGALVPISLVRRRDLPPGPRPLLLRGYGAYGICSDPRFARNELSLLDRGVTFAIAHIRGGQEMGRPWYEQGKLLRKRNTFTDFIACAEHLVEQGYTAPDQLIAQGGSAGGIIMGVIANERPDLFHAIVAQVPFVDVLRVMLDPSLPLTTSEYVEWGDPRQPAFRDYIAAYSPYDNVAARAYPHLFITGGIEDDQVPFWQPAKWTAKLRAAQTADRLLLLRTNLGAGHRGDSGFSNAQREVAMTYAFILLALGERG